MINLKNSMLLAGTKLKTRKVRLIVTVVISSLLFGVLAVGIITFTGFTESVARFSNQGLNNRFFVSVSQISGPDLFNYADSDAGRKRATEIANQLADQQFKRAKELGLELTRKDVLESILPEGYFKEVDDYKPSAPIDDSLLGRSLAADFRQKNPVENPEMVLNQANVDRITAGYSIVSKTQSKYYQIASGSLYITDAKGGYPLNSQPTVDANHSPVTQEVLSQIMVLPADVAEAYRFKNLKSEPNAKTVPIMVAFGKAEKLLRLKQLPTGASNQDILNRQREVREKVAGLKFKQCYRNNLALDQLESAATHVRNHKDKDYIKPELIYGLPADHACQVAPVIADTRLAETKKYQAAMEKFEVEFRGRDALPIAREIEFEVVGLLPPTNPDYNNSSLANNLIQMAIGSLYTEVVAADTDLAAAIKQQNLSSIIVDQASIYTMDSHDSWLVEFKDLSEAQRFIQQRDCATNSFSQTTGLVMMDSGQSIKCTSEYPFMAYPVINNRIMLQDIIDGLFKFGLILLVVFSVIATIIMMGTVGRMITDSRRETAVFRAIGFKRLDISMIYGLYTLIACLFITGVSFGLGFLGAAIIASRLDAELTIQAIIATTADDHSLKMSMIGWSPLYLGLLMAAILVVGLLSISLPLIRNLRRNPIKDMRDE